MAIRCFSDDGGQHGGSGGEGTRGEPSPFTMSGPGPTIVEADGVTPIKNPGMVLAAALAEAATLRRERDEAVGLLRTIVEEEWLAGHALGDLATAFLSRLDTKAKT